MTQALRDVLRNKIINGWSLFYLISAPISFAMIVAIGWGDLSTGPGISALIQLSVRCAVPPLYMAFAASSIHALLSSDGSAWLLRNRKYFGLSFAVAMAWQAFFIVWMVAGYTDYYVHEVYLTKDAIEGTVGYLFLIPMVVTSFKPGRRLLSRKNWNRLHTVGIYYLWAYAFSVYWWSIFYYETPVFLDYLFYVSGFLVWGVRAGAWVKLRRKKTRKESPDTRPVRSVESLGLVAVGVGVVGVFSGSLWRTSAEEVLYGYKWTAPLEAFVPYWPLEPFLPLLMISFGAYLIGQALSALR